MHISRKTLWAFAAAAALLGATTPAVIAEYDSKPVTEAEATTEMESTPMSDMSMMPLGEYLQGQEEFSTLYTALQEADLVETLEGLDAYTLFAPTNDAFEALPEGQLDALLAEPDTLAQLLQYHVLDQTLSSSDLEAMEYDTLEGTPVSVELGEEVLVGGATVLQTDLSPETGKIHSIDSVLIPQGLVLPEPVPAN